MFGASAQLQGNQSSFRYGSQNAVGQSAQATTTEEFPPLRNGNGDIGGDRPASLVQSVGFGAPSSSMNFGTANTSQPSRANGLLSAVSGSSRVAGGSRVASSNNLSGK